MNSGLVKELGHRFSTVVHALRLRGWEIDVIELNGDSVHRLVAEPEELLVKVTEQIQKQYYETWHWKQKRLERLQLDEYRCCFCGASEALQVHHWQYRLFDESLFDLMTLCERCHERVHSFPNVNVHFPRFLPKAIVRQISESSAEQS